MIMALDVVDSSLRGASSRYSAEPKHLSTCSAVSNSIRMTLSAGKEYLLLASAGRHWLLKWRQNQQHYSGGIIEGERWVGKAICLDE